MEIVVAEDKNLERHGLLAKLVRVFSVPLINILPGSALKKIMSANNDAKKLLENMGSAEAMEVMYSRYDKTLFSNGILQGLLNLFWHHCVSNPKAIRNRLKIVEYNLEKEISAILKNGGKNISILTIGGGSGRSIMEVLNKFKNREVSFKVLDIERSSGAIELSKKNAAQKNLKSIFTWINNKAENIDSLVKGESIDICEMVGVLDYLPEGEGRKVISQIYQSLKINGLLITGNIFPDKEHSILDKMGWPKMYYRKPEEIAGILKQSGFSLEKTIFILEPLKNHVIVITRK